jgi:YVTN family beta-propeller protein
MKLGVSILLLCCTSMAFGQGSDLLLVGNKQDADLSVIEVTTGRTIKRIPTGEGPHEVAVSRDGKLAVVANYGAATPGNSLTVIDAKTLEVVRTVSLDNFTRPHGIAFMPDHRTVAVTSETSRAVVLVDVVAGTVSGSVATGQQGSHMVSVHADGKRAYTANIGSGTATALDLERRQAVQTFQIGPQSEAIALSPDARELWVGSNQAGTVSVFDVATSEQIARLDAPGVPIRVYFSPDGKRVLVSSAQASTVRFFDAVTRKQEAAITVQGTPIGAVFSPDGARAYVALTGANRIAVIHLKSMTVIASHETGAGPDGIAYLALHSESRDRKP